MKITVSEAKAQLTDLVRRAEAGEEVILTRHGHPAVRLVPERVAPSRESRRAVIDADPPRGPKTIRRFAAAQRVGAETA